MPKQGVKKYFFFTKKQVSSDWKDLAECLEFETPDIENIEGKRRDDKSRCMELLQEWQKRKGNAATIHVLMEALQEAELQHVVDSLKDRYPVLPVHLQLGLEPQMSAQGGISKEREEQLLARILELERTLFTADVLMDDDRRKKAEQVLLSHKAFLTGLLSGSVLLLLTFLRQTDVDRFYHNHYRVGEGTLSQQLSHILISDDLQDKVKGAQLIVRLQVKHEDYVRVRNRLGQGLDRTTSMDNLLALPPPSRHVDRSSLRGLDLAVVSRSREDQSCTDESGDIPALNFTARQVQTAMYTSRRKSQQQVRRLEGEHRVQMHTVREQMREAKEQTDAMVRSQTKEITRMKEKDEKAQKILLEQKEENQKLSEANKSMAATIDEQMVTDVAMPSEAARSLRGIGLDRTTSVDNLLALPPPSRRVDHSSLSALDLAVIGQEDQSCADGTDDVSELKFTVGQVQGVVQVAMEKSKQQVKVQLETMQGR
ncbi:hypothetical protein Bbelb_230910 [Branchiostoma belcheri]|nr:hypothetical protein Bbelb_230910 [Branchiostoma belcheri]